MQRKEGGPAVPGAGRMRAMTTPRTGGEGASSPSLDYSAVLHTVAEELDRNYVIAEVGQRAAAILRQIADSGGLAGVTGAAELCERTTAIVRDLSGDLHLRLIHHPDGAPEQQDEQSYHAYWSSRATASAGGVRRVERLDDSVALVEFGPFIGLPVHAAPWLTAAMNLCHGARAVLIDLRRCAGGTPDGTALICSYLFGPEPVHLSDVWTRGEVRQFWTLPTVPGRRLPVATPVAVLVSGETFSGGEELAFNLAELGRATVVGEVTRGGAHPRIGIRVHDEIELALPVAVPRSPRTGRNWEGTGVQPHVVCPAEEALSRALELFSTSSHQGAGVAGGTHLAGSFAHRRLLA